MTEDLVIGAVDNYTYHEIEPWLVSLERSGYTGKKALIAYNMQGATADKLESKGVLIFSFQRDRKGNLRYAASKSTSIMVERFAHLWHFLAALDLRYVVATDVRDVLFQGNPSDWLQGDLGMSGRKILVGSEYLRYRDEPWNRNNMVMAFGQSLYELVADRPIYCAGVIAGFADSVRELFLNISLICRGMAARVPGGGGPDQAALNVLLSTGAYQAITQFRSAADEWVCHAATTQQAIKSGKGEIGHQYRKDPTVLSSFANATLCPDPIFRDELVCTNQGVPYAIVHQYDRVSTWFPVLDRKYRA
jgi:hypothetical protein